MNEARVEQAIKDLLIALNQNVEDSHIKETPKRVAKAYGEILQGYTRNLEDEMTTFSNDEQYDEIVYSGKINFFSTCEHHLLPFFGTAHVAYIPGEKIAGLSKLSRAIEIYSRRLQQQERITTQAADELTRLLAPKGVAVMMEGQHFCNAARGVQQVDSNMKTFAYRGVFKEDANLRHHFLDLTR